RPFLYQDRLESLHDLRGLHRMGPTATREVMVGLGNMEIAKEGGRHSFVIMLSGMHEDRANAPLVSSPDDGRDLHEIWPGSCNDEKLHLHSAVSRNACPARE